MKYCINCLLPDTKPDLSFDENGKCDACIAMEEKKKIDWEKRRIELGEILNKYKNKDDTNYDCIIPVSGGKDSHYQTHVIKNEFGLNPLLVSFHPRDFTEIGRKNIENLKGFGVDCIEFSVNPVTYKKLANYGLHELGDPAWPEHIGIFTIPVKIAVALKIPLLIWGENSQLEYGGPAAARANPYLDIEWNKKFGGYFREKLDIKSLTNLGIKESELQFCQYPSDEEIKTVGVTGIFLGYYLKWDARKQVEIVKKLGFNGLDEPNEGTYINYENLDTKYVGIHDYFKFLKYGYGRATDHASLDIRNGRMTREEGLELVKKYDGKIPTKYLNEFLNEFELTMYDFKKICDKFTNKNLFKKDKDGNLLRDEVGNIEKIKYNN